MACAYIPPPTQRYWTRVGKLFQGCANEGISGGELSLSGSSPSSDDDFDQFWTAQVLMRSGQYGAFNFVGGVNVGGVI